MHPEGYTLVSVPESCNHHVSSQRVSTPRAEPWFEDHPEVYYSAAEMMLQNEYHFVLKCTQSQRKGRMMCYIVGKEDRNTAAKLIQLIHQRKLAPHHEAVSSPVCVEVPSETEAVQGTDMKLLCISCMKREEVTASTVVEWFYRPEGGKDEPIYEHRKMNHEFPSRFSGRIQWNGSKDMQDVSITVLNVTLNDSGIYTCNITREFEFEIHRPLFTSSRLIHLTVVEEAGEDFTSVISEIMMYILLVFLTLWLLIEMVYCYRKVSKAEEAAQENATDYLAIPSENKENCAVPVEE
uniref:Sodium channel regulatory subunit beta-3 n=1 Tax=Gallus gallus TaxID=9031 RepID=A0A8V1A7Q9_CHICK